jgi:hypothetical protein
MAIDKKLTAWVWKFPEYCSVEDFHIGEELFHVGP